MAVGLPFLHSLRFNLCGIAHPNFDAEFCEQSLEPA
jgi:hypothetical protein